MPGEGTKDCKIKTMPDSFDDNIDHLFYDSLQRREDIPRKSVWEKIENSLDEHDQAILISVRRKRIGIALVIGLLMIFNPLTLKQTNLFNQTRTGRDLKMTSQNNIGFKTEAQNANALPGKLSWYQYEQQNNDAQIALRTLAFAHSEKNYLPELTLDSNRFLFIPESTDSWSPDVLLRKEFFFGKKETNMNNSTVRLQETNTGKFSATVYLSRDYAGYNFSDHDIIGPGGKEIESRERNILSRSAGIYLNYKLSRKLVLQSGLSYSWSNNSIDSANSYAVKGDNGVIQFKFNTVSGYTYLDPPASAIPIVGDSISTAKSYTQLRHLTIPLILSYKIPIGRFSILAGAGLTFNLLTSASLETVVYGHNFKQNESQIPIRGLKKINVGVLVKTELDYHFLNRWAIEIIPSFRNTLSPVNLNSSVSAYPYNFGIGAGIRYLF
jgi:hypothetical protein